MFTGAGSSRAAVDGISKNTGKPVFTGSYPLELFRQNDRDHFVTHLPKSRCFRIINGRKQRTGNRRASIFSVRQPVTGSTPVPWSDFIKVLFRYYRYRNNNTEKPWEPSKSKAGSLKSMPGLLFSVYDKRTRS